MKKTVSKSVAKRLKVQKPKPKTETKDYSSPSAVRDLVATLKLLQDKLYKEYQPLEKALEDVQKTIEDHEDIQYHIDSIFEYIRDLNK